METFPLYWPFVWGIHRPPVNSPHKGQWRGALVFSLICAWIKGWVNNGETGDLRRHRSHYDVIVMSSKLFAAVLWNSSMGKHKNVVLNHLFMMKYLYTRHIISGIWVYKTSPICPLHVAVNSILLHLLLHSSTIAGRWHFKRALDPCKLVNQIYTTPLHGDVIKWKHFPCYWPFVRGIHRSPVNLPAQRPVTRSFDVFFDLRLNKRLSKQSWGWWFETPSRPLWRHCKDQAETRMSDKYGVGVFILLCATIDIN